MSNKAIHIKRIYEEPNSADGFRILIDRLWPRGVKKEDAAIDLWAKEIAPSNDLRQWFNHEPEKWNEFKKRYFGELKDQQESVNLIIEKSHDSVITLLYGAKDEKHNNAIVLQEYLNKQIKSN